MLVDPWWTRVEAAHVLAADQGGRRTCARDEHRPAVCSIAAPGDGVLRVTWPVDAPMPWVDPRDIGDVAVARLLSTDSSGRQVQAGGRPDAETGSRAGIRARSRRPPKCPAGRRAPVRRSA